jgi:hypothetical protein
LPGRSTSSTWVRCRRPCTAFGKSSTGSDHGLPPRFVATTLADAELEIPRLLRGSRPARLPLSAS